MTENESPKRRRKKKRSWTYYIPTAIMLVLAVFCVAVITVAVTSLLDSKDDITINTVPPKTDPVTAPTETTEPKDEITIEELIDQADRLALGYDYDAAIELLRSSSQFETSGVLKDKMAEYTQRKSECSAYAAPETVTHIFFHSLIVDTDRAFDGDEDEGGYNMYMTTVDEFKAILEEMYYKGYVLISPYDLAYEVTDEAGNSKFVYGDIMLPAGKTPFLMSQDDLNYYCYMVGNGNGKNETPIFNDPEYNDGFASRVVIGEDGKPTCEYVDADGNVLYGDYDLVPVLETFIQEHPDFSYRGARAILGMTGYEGVFGYRTKPSYEKELNEMYEAGEYPWDYATEVQKAKDVAQCLRDNGWILASHSYGHPRYGDISAERVETDSDKWEDTVESIIGEVDIILYPNGSDIHTWRNYTFDNAKFAALYEDGYRYFFNVDSNTYWNQLGSNYFRGGRRNLDGYRMYYNPDKLADLFDVDKVFDDSRPLPVPTIGNGM